MTVMFSAVWKNISTEVVQKKCLSFIMIYVSIYYLIPYYQKVDDYHLAWSHSLYLFTSFSVYFSFLRYLRLLLRITFCAFRVSITMQMIPKLNQRAECTKPKPKETLKHIFKKINYRFNFALIFLFQLSLKLARNFVMGLWQDCVFNYSGKIK